MNRMKFSLEGLIDPLGWKRGLCMSRSILVYIHDVANSSGNKLKGNKLKNRGACKVLETFGGIKKAREENKKKTQNAQRKCFLLMF